MYRFSIKLKGENHAIIQTYGFDENKEITAMIGIILPDTKCIEYLKVEGWVATYKGVSEDVKSKVIEVYNKNQMVIHKNILAFID